MKADRTIADALREQVLVFDGAMGTEIYRRKVFVNQCFDELCLSRPGMIREIHDEYCRAGAEVLTTNSFGANRLELSRFGLAEQLRDINTAAVRIAREAADAAPERVFVAASIGPANPSRPEGDDIPAVIGEQVGIVAQAGADAIIFETLPTRRAVEQCVAGIAAANAALPFILSVTVDDRYESAAGEPIERLLAPFAADLPQPVAWGLNCSIGPDAILGAVEQALKVLSLPLIVQPNAGKPREVGNRYIYLCSPEYLSTYALRFVNLGARAVGGCCGTTPDHIREIARAVKPLTKRRFTIGATTKPDGVRAKAESEFGERSTFAWRLANRKWVTSVEILPPRGYDLAKTLERARLCHRHGVDAINIPDGPRASSLLSPLITAAFIQKEAGIEAILHFCCRDRNLIGMQADLFACACCGVRNILFITGDPPKLGAYPFASGVFDADSIGMVKVQAQLNRGIDLGGQEIDPPTHAVIGVGTDPNAIDQEREIRRLREKVAGGAHFVITQPVFDSDALLRFLDKLPDITVPILAGIWPLASYRNAAFMRNELPGVVVPDSVMDRMASVSSREDQVKMGIDIAREAVDAVRDHMAGIQVSAPFGNVRTALAVMA